MTSRQLAEQICATLRGRGHQAYFVGGCVRDLVLGREPADYDVCTDARPERVQELFPRSLSVGAKFGVILVVDDGVQVEVATFRSDIGYSDGRHPDRVVYSKTAEEDVPPARFHHQRIADGPGDRRSPRLRRRAHGFARGHRARDRRSAPALHGRQAAHAARGALCRALRLPDRARDYGCGAESRSAGPGGFPRAHSRRTDQAAHRRQGAARLRAAGRNGPACCCAPRRGADEGRPAAAAVSSRGRRSGFTRA